MTDFSESDQMSSQKISRVSDQVNRAQYSGEKQSFVVDIDNFSTNSSDKEQCKTPTSRILSFSRKGSTGGGKKMTNLSYSSIESPGGSASACSPKTPMAFVAVENHIGSDHHHYVTIRGSGSGTKSCSRRLNRSIRGPRSIFAIDPRKVVFVFATLSSLGSLVLIYFTLAIKKMNEEGG